MGREDALGQIGDDFKFVAEAYCRVLMLERQLPVWKKTIPPLRTVGGVAGGDKYRIMGILFKFSVDSTGAPMSYLVSFLIINFLTFLIGIVITNVNMKKRHVWG
jgi:hypothetical protein